MTLNEITAGLRKQVQDPELAGEVDAMLREYVPGGAYRVKAESGEREGGKWAKEVYTVGGKPAIETGQDLGPGGEVVKRWNKTFLYENDVMTGEEGWNFTPEGEKTGGWEKTFKYDPDGRLSAESGTNLDAKGNRAGTWRKEFTLGPDGKVIGEAGEKSDSEGKLVKRWEK